MMTSATRRGQSCTTWPRAPGPGDLYIVRWPRDLSSADQAPGHAHRPRPARVRPPRRRGGGGGGLDPGRGRHLLRHLLRCLLVSWPKHEQNTCRFQIPFIIACLCKNLKDLNSLKVSNGHWTDCFCVHFIDSFLLKLCCSIGARILQFAALQTLQHSPPAAGMTPRRTPGCSWTAWSMGGHPSPYRASAGTSLPSLAGTWVYPGLNNQAFYVQCQLWYISPNDPIIRYVDHASLRVEH